MPTYRKVSGDRVALVANSLFGSGASETMGGRAKILTTIPKKGAAHLFDTYCKNYSFCEVCCKIKHLLGAGRGLSKWSLKRGN